MRLSKMTNYENNLPDEKKFRVPRELIYRHEGMDISLMMEIVDKFHIRPNPHAKDETTTPGNQTARNPMTSWNKPSSTTPAKTTHKPLTQSKVVGSTPYKDSKFSPQTQKEQFKNDPKSQCKTPNTHTAAPKSARIPGGAGGGRQNLSK